MRILYLNMFGYINYSEGNETNLKIRWSQEKFKYTFDLGEGLLLLLLYAYYL